jgi:hypothetical protein
MPTITPDLTFFVNWVLGAANLTVFTYNRTTNAFTATANAAGRASLVVNPTDMRFSVSGTEAIIIDDAGLVTVTKLTEFVDPTVPRLDFLIKLDSVPKRMTSIDENGSLWSPKFDEEPVVNSDEQIRFFTLAAILWPKGFIANSFKEL